MARTLRYLVTGGAGFIGSHLVDALLADGQNVIVLDDFSEGKMENLPDGHPNLEIKRVSVLEDIGKFFKGVDVVFHLGALTRPEESIHRPQFYNETNVKGTLNVLTAAYDHSCLRVVFASSASVYGEQDKYPCAEEATPNPISPYAAQKLMGEVYCKLFSKIYKLPTVALRFFNVYGSRMDPDTAYAALIPGFIKQIKEGKQPTIYGTGRQARDFIHVDDVVRALLAAAKTPATGEVYNVGYGENYSVNQVFDLIRTNLNKKIEPIYAPPRIEPSQTLADRGKAYIYLGWQPFISLEEGIERLTHA